MLCRLRVCENHILLSFPFSLEKQGRHLLVRTGSGGVAAGTSCILLGVFLERKIS